MRVALDAPEVSDRHDHVMETSAVAVLEGQVMRAVSITARGSEYHAFLYAPISEDREGMTLSVLSALARQELDPWTEAARLAQWPPKTATEQIMSLLDLLPGRIVATLDRGEVARRLSALLPRHAALNPLSMLHSSTTETPKPTVIDFSWRYFYLYFCFMMLMNWLVSESRSPPVARIETSSATVSRAPASTLPSKDPGQASTAEH
jgi:hypothetical protein